MITQGIVSFEVSLDRDLREYEMITKFFTKTDGTVIIEVYSVRFDSNIWKKLFFLKYSRDEVNSSQEEIRLQVLTYAALVR